MADSLDDFINSFEKNQENARKKAEAEGKTEVTSEEHETNPVVRLNKLYEDWIDYWADSGLEKKLADFSLKFRNVDYSFYDIVRFVSSFPQLQREYKVKESLITYDKLSVPYLTFMVGLAQNLKHSAPESEVKRNGFSVFFNPKGILPQLSFLFKNSQDARLRFNGLDEVVVIECEYISTREFRSGKMVLDCNPTSRFFAGNYGLKGGQLTLTDKVKPYQIGERMEGGTLIYLGDLEGGSIGKEMKEGLIIVNGNIKNCYGIGNKMKKGTIRIKGGVIQSMGGEGIGYGMEGGKIQIDKSVRGDHGSGYASVGSSMEGGEVRILGGVSDLLHVGIYLSGGDIIIGTDSNPSYCQVHSIGNDMRNGNIVIYGNAGTSIGGGISGGAIEINGNVNQWEGDIVNGVGSNMKGGTITINGKVDCVGSEMRGGTIRVNGRLSNRDEFLQYGGHVYVNDVEIRPRTPYRIIGAIIKKLE